MGLWEGDAAQALFVDAPQVPSSGTPTCPYHPMFLSRSAPADALAFLEVAEHSVVFFAGMVHQLEVTKDGALDEGEAINFTISCVAPPLPPRPVHHVVALVQHCPSLAQPQVHAWQGLVHPPTVRL